MVKHARKKQKLSKEHEDLKADDIHNVADKDDEERRLESLLFGTTFVGSANGTQEEDDEAEQDGLEVGGNQFANLTDGDLFFVDVGNDEEQAAGPSSASSSSSSESSGSGSESDSGSDSSSSSRTSSTGSSAKKTIRKSKAPAWVDPSDPATVSLSSKRLRKLRDAPHEEELHGREYESRLRRQFERINPEPTWAAQARKSKAKEKKQAWADDDDGDEEDESTDVQHLLTSTSGVLRSQKTKRVLQAGTIDIARLRDANQDAQEAACGDIKSLAFHPSPTVPVLAVGSKDRRVRLYTIDGHLSPLLQTVHVPSLPLTSQSSVQFHPGGTQILLTGSRPFFYVYDLQSGTLAGGAGGAGVRGLWGTRWDDPSTSVDPGRKRGRGQNQNGNSNSGSGSMDVSAFSPTGDVLAVAGRGGYVHLVDWKASASTGGGAGQVIGSLKCSSSGPSGGGVKGMWWVHPSANEGGRTHLAILSGDSEVYLWDVGERRCVRRWTDEGGFRGSARVFAGSTNSPRGGLLSVGSSSGLVNMYDSSAFAGSLSDTKSPKPIKTLSNLVTPISTMRYNPDGQVLAVASREKKDALKLYHSNSLTTYANWPTSGTPLGHVTSIDFSAGSEYLAIGNTKGRVLLFSLKDYCT
ncbi:U3 snoRNP protein [Marasmius tenuissimus]|uniref:U3 snoRNP protein n=1 Tax=Marasmius tenuissimus TaxID=585030 RepID=A0ABR2ZVR8_9AGAR